MLDWWKQWYVMCTDTAQWQKCWWKNKRGRECQKYAKGNAFQAFQIFFTSGRSNVIKKKKRKWKKKIGFDSMLLKRQSFFVIRFCVTQNCTVLTKWQHEHDFVYCILAEGDRRTFCHWNCTEEMTKLCPNKSASGRKKTKSFNFLPTTFYASHSDFRQK